MVKTCALLIAAALYSAIAELLVLRLSRLADVDHITCYFYLSVVTQYRHSVIDIQLLFKTVKRHQKTLFSTLGASSFACSADFDVKNIISGCQVTDNVTVDNMQC